MKKVLMTVLAILLIAAMTSCITNTLAPTSQSTDNTTSQSAADNNPAPQSQADDNGRTPTPQSEQAQDAASQNEENPDDNRDMIIGTLYAVFGASETREHDFGYEDGTLTPEKIANSLSALTGLNFDISVTYVSTTENSITIEWNPNSSLATGIPPEPQNEDFFFFDRDSLRWFMLNSLCRSIRENYGEVDVYYTINGGMDINSLELGVDFHPAIPFNQVEDANALG